MRVSDVPRDPVGTLRVRASLSGGWVLSISIQASALLLRAV